MGTLRYSPLRAAVDITVIAVAFWLAGIAFAFISGLEPLPEDWFWIVPRVLLFWLAVYLQDFSGMKSWLSLLAVQFYAGMGLNLIFQAAMVNFIPITRDLGLVALESVFASAGLTLIHWLVYNRTRKEGTLILGDLPLPAEL